MIAGPPVLLNIYATTNNTTYKTSYFNFSYENETFGVYCIMTRSLRDRMQLTKLTLVFFTRKDD